VSYDLQRGIEKLRWGQSPQEVITAYPHAIRTLSLTGRDHETANDFHIEPGLMISDFLQLPSFAVWAHVNFDQHRAIGIDLYPHVTFPQRHLPPYVRRALSRLDELLGIKINLDGELLQTWIVDKVHIELHRARTDFMICIYAPGTEKERSSYGHRSYRRSQAQRCLAKTMSPAGAWLDALDEKPKGK
jgi:hypothetical protein